MRIPKVKGLFVTGTDTGVGKTVLSAFLLSEAKSKGLDAAFMKPVQTGCIRKHGRLMAPDFEFCVRFAGLKVGRGEYGTMVPYRFVPACSPHLAARRARIKIHIGKIRACYEQLAENHDLVIVEGAGGVLVPLNERETMLDLMKALKLPVLLAARPGLGTINHTLLSLRELKRAGLNVAGVVFVESEKTKRDYILRDNLKIIQRFGKTPCVGWIPFVRGLNAEGRTRPTKGTAGRSRRRREKR